MGDKYEVWKICRAIPGWLTDREGLFLYDLAKNCSGRGCIVEIGSWKGKSSVWLGRGSQAGAGVAVYAIDPHEGSQEHQKMLGKVWTFDEFQRYTRLGGVDEVVVPIVKRSLEAASDFDHGVELLFIDGAHDYHSARQDLEVWLPKLVEGAIVVIHDTLLPGYGPRRVAREFLVDSPRFRNLGFVDSMAYAEMGASSWLDRRQKKYAWRRKIGYNAMLLVISPLIVLPMILVLPYHMWLVKNTAAKADSS